MTKTAATSNANSDASSDAAVGANAGATGAETAADALARLDDLDLADDPGDLDLDLALAGRTGGPVLELGAGSGRIAVPLAFLGQHSLVIYLLHQPVIILLLAALTGTKVL